MGTILFLLAAFFILALNYSDLPEQIPVHYNGEGEIDKYGPKINLWVVPILASLICFGIVKSNKWIPKMNPKIVERELFVINWGSRILSLLIAFSFSYITIQTVNIARKGSGSLGTWFLPVAAICMIIMPFLPLIWFKKKR
ncbi:DUF1648 domain-containing protein [Flavobacteriaceae bacterium D16]|nr:DUF1648 domain-containing protein [Flavobacteriaceae bacterium D16]